MKKIEKGATTDVANNNKDEEVMKIVRKTINEAEFDMLGHCPADSENEIDTDDEEFIEHEEEIYIEAKQILIYTLISETNLSNYEIIGFEYSINELKIKEQLYKIADLYNKLNIPVTSKEYYELRKEIVEFRKLGYINYNKKIYNMNIFNRYIFITGKFFWWILEVQRHFDFDFALYLIDLLLELDEDEIADEASNLIVRLTIWRLYKNKVINEEDVTFLMSRIKECKLTYEFFDEELVEYWKSKAFNGKKFEESR